MRELALRSPWFCGVGTEAIGKTAHHSVLQLVIDESRRLRCEGWQPNGTHFKCFAALSCVQYGPAKAGFRLKAGTTNFRTGVCSTEL